VSLHHTFLIIINQERQRKNDGHHERPRYDFQLINLLKSYIPVATGPLLEQSQ